jgi:acyl-CoA thioesterase
VVFATLGIVGRIVGAAPRGSERIVRERDPGIGVTTARVSSQAFTSFAELLARVPASLESGQTVRVEVPADWGQGRSTFGGALTGLGLTALEAVVARERAESPRRCRSMMVSFAGPVAPGEVELEARVLRHGRSATHASATLIQDGSLRCAIMASFASPRPSAIEVAGVARPELAAPEHSLTLPFVPGLVPEFTRHLELRWASGGPPGSRLAQTGFTGWVRFHEHSRELGPAWIAALVDAWPAPALQMLRKPAIASSLTWAIDFVDHDPAAASDELWAFAVATDRAAGGWVHTRGRLWSPNGLLVATSSQTVALFA